MKRRLLVILAVLTSGLIVAGCRTSGSGGGPRRALDVLIEEGNPSEMGERQYQYRCEVRDYMQRELPRRFARHGFNVRLITQRGAATSDLLVIRYTSYNPGSSAARMAVGFGAGAASLNIAATLSSGGQELLSWTEGCGTSGHWTRLVDKLDASMGKKLADFYRHLRVWSFSAPTPSLFSAATAPALHPQGV